MDFSNLQPLASGVDSRVFLDSNTSTVYKAYNPETHPDEILKWYCDLAQKMSELGNKVLKEITDPDGKKYTVSCTINPHSLAGTHNDENYVSTPFTHGPTILSFYQDKFQSSPRTATSYIDNMPESEEKEELRLLNKKIQSEGSFKFMEEIYQVYCDELVDWIKQNLPKAIAEKYSFPGEMNVKVRMPTSNTIQFVITDIFGDLLKNYKKLRSE